MRRLLSLILVLYFVVGCGGEPTPTPDAVATQIAIEKAAHATMTAEAPPPTGTPTNTPTLTPTPTDTQTPTPTSTTTPTPTPTPLIVLGKGSKQTEPIIPPASITIAKFTFKERDMYTVQVLVNNRPIWQLPDMNIVNNPPENSERVIAGQKSFVVDIETVNSTTAAWEISIRPIGITDSSEFKGRGNAVSDLFAVPDGEPVLFRIAHDTEFNFDIYLHCTGGTQHILHGTYPKGQVNGTTTVVFPKGPCFWEVLAPYSSWSIMPSE